MSRVLSNLLLSASLVASPLALAHVSFYKDINNIPVTEKTIIATLNVPHGCKGLDTNKIEVKMPTDMQLAGIMPMHSIFGKAKIIKDNTGKITTLVWEQKAEDIQIADSHLYQISFRVTLAKINPDITQKPIALTPFTTVGFETTQYCGNNNDLTEVWTGANTPTLYILPARNLGWNKYTVPSALDLTTSFGKKFFEDAAVVWKGKEGHSANSSTMDLIKKNATELKQIPAGSEIWVKY
jgi:uncharacterized protein YcnI